MSEENKQFIVMGSYVCIFVIMLFIGSIVSEYVYDQRQMKKYNLVASCRLQAYKTSQSPDLICGELPKLQDPNRK